MKPTEMKESMQVIIETLAILCAIGTGIIAFMATYYAPILLSPSFMIWGFLGAIPALIVGHKAGGYVRAIIRRKFFPNSYPNEAEQKRRAGLLLTGIGFLFFAGYLPFTSSLSDRLLSVVSFSLIGLCFLYASIVSKPK
jgi:ABC-type phosphate transport system permease subunit